MGQKAFPLMLTEWVTLAVHRKQEQKMGPWARFLIGAGQGGEQRESRNSWGDPRLLVSGRGEGAVSCSSSICKGLISSWDHKF